MTDASLDGQDEDEDCLREGELHLYILSYSSPLLMLTKSAWDNYLIRGTLEEDIDYLIKRGDLLGKKTKASSSAVGKVSEKLEKLFGQLKTEMLDPENTMEDIFTLGSELKNAAERNFALKKLFWKTPDLFVFCVKQLQRYLPKSPHPQNTDSSEAKQERADEFELLNLILEILALMFRETETSSSRITTMKAGAGKLVLDLIVTLVCFPELPQKYVPPSSKVQTLLKSSQSDQWKCMADVELSKLVAEFTDMVTVILFELMLISHQANWGDATGNFLNMSWIIKILEEVNTTEKFVERLIAQAMRLISPSRDEELTPSQAVLVYQQFFVLQTLVEYSPRTVAFIRNNFCEEFQYYIHAPVIVRKLPTKYLIRKNTIKLIQQVMSTILQKKIRLI